MLGLTSFFHQVNFELKSKKLLYFLLIIKKAKKSFFIFLTIKS